jgi:hypothetical protein
MSGSLRVIDVTVPTRRVLPYVRRESVSPRAAWTPEVREIADKPVYRATESLAAGTGVVLPRFKHALDVYQQNTDARRTLLTGQAFFVDTYA